MACGRCDRKMVLVDAKKFRNFTFAFNFKIIIPHIPHMSKTNLIISFILHCIIALALVYFLRSLYTFGYMALTRDFFHPETSPAIQAYNILSCSHPTNTQTEASARRVTISYSDMYAGCTD